ncbi:hypothetical protein LV89_00029 [Arcicella aurantiaca]|uniref:HipA-like C-terminal domain-containing protein n=1 Tax=Arcicella aurantiaca TaxID=591202 RepID=A0A316EHF8_9BACT|nr:hypothetical protein [Arcicella aurantiaca]PWK29191.1 hypothetical protein LV89_00029 [Arcicella aurantiaca]
MMILKTTFTDLSDWIPKEWERPQKGSSSITIFEQPETSEVYFFKESHTRYELEFWSEIISSKFGQMLGLNVLDYNIGYYKGNLGCLSKRMVNPDEGQVLYHGVEILNDHIETFIMSDKPFFSYQDIEELCKKDDFNHLLTHFHELIIFDALIGNTDRHTENWAFIRNFSAKIDLPKLNPNSNPTLFKLIFHFLLNRKKYSNYFQNNDSKLKLSISTTHISSSIYDSGCCLGREIEEIKIQDFIKDKKRIESYTEKGKSEIRWNKDRIGLFEIVRQIHDTDNQSLKSIFNQLKIDNLHDSIKSIVTQIDEQIPLEIQKSRLTLHRKHFITELLIFRFQKLKNILD